MLTRWATGTAVAISARIPMSSVWTERAGFMPYSIAIACGAIVAYFVPIV
jgi:Flp pilus assembly protein protease CpaA